jgi:hypothetical protein
MEFNWPSILKPSGNKTDWSQLRRFESDLGFNLPNDYRAFLLALNGGKVFIDHEIHIPELSCDVFVNYLWPLTSASPAIGIKESRDIQVIYRQAVRQALKIGDNMGTGFFFLILDGNERGAVYFGFKDDLPMREGDWFSSEVRIPDCMARISPTFTDLGRTIMLHKLRT